MALVVLLLVLPLLASLLYTNQASTAPTPVADSLAAQLNEQLQAVQAPVTTHRLFAFNPNTCPYDSLVALGIPPFLARRMVNYRTKGGRFRQPADLKRIYDFPDSLYQRLASYITLPPRATAQTAYAQNRSRAYPTTQQRGRYAAGGDSLPPWPTARWQPKPFDLNKTDTASLMAIYGVGPAYSRRILKYRGLLGGYISTDQLSEVWGLPDSTVAAIKALTFVTPDFEPQLVSINTDSAALLGRHPYIPYAMAKVMVAYGKQHNGYDSLPQLKNIHIMTDSLFIKMYPYLKL